MSGRIPKAEVLFRAAAQYLAAHDTSDPRGTRAWWVIHNAAWRFAARCAEQDGDLVAVEREGERLYCLLSAAAGTEEIIADERRKLQGGPL